MFKIKIYITLAKFDEAWLKKAFQQLKVFH